MPNLLKFLALSMMSLSLFAQTEGPGKADAKTPQTLAQRTEAMQHKPGLLGLDWDAKAGKVFLEVPMSGNASHTRSDELLYTSSLPHGTGSNDLGLDRGQVSEGRVVRFERNGPKVLLIEPNDHFRSSATDAAEQASVHESFADSVMWGFKVEAEAPDGTVLLDATDFFVRDSRGVVEVLSRLQQGTFHFDASRSAVVPEEIKAFPKNVVVESIVTLASDGPVRGRFVRDVTPDPHDRA